MSHGDRGYRNWGRAGPHTKSTQDKQEPDEQDPECVGAGVWGCGVDRQDHTCWITQFRPQS